MRTDFAHSEPLNLAAETGLIGMVLFLSALGLSIAVPRRAEASWTQEAALGAAAAMGVQCLVDNMLHMPGLAYLFFSALAVSQTRPAMSAVSGMPVWGKLAAVGGLSLALVAWVPGMLVESYSSRAQNEEEPEMRLSLARRAAAIYPAEAALREELARAWLAQNPPGVDEALGELAQASRRNPTNAIYPVMSAELLRARREWPRVLEFSEEALRLEPNFLQARLLKAEVLARQGKKAAARAELAEVRRRRADMEKALLYTGNRALYNGYDFTVGAYDEARVDLVSRLSR